MDLDTIRIIWTILAGLIGFLVMAFGFAWRSFGQVHQRIDAVTERIGAVEAEIRHLPNTEQIASLQSQIGVLNADMREALVTMKHNQEHAITNKAAMERIENFLLKQRGEHG